MTIMDFDVTLLKFSLWSLALPMIIRRKFQ